MVQSVFHSLIPFQLKQICQSDIICKQKIVCRRLKSFRTLYSYYFIFLFHSNQLSVLSRCRQREICQSIRSIGQLYFKQGRYMPQPTVQQYAFLLNDCLAAIAKPIQTLLRSLSQQRQIIEKTFDAPLPKGMSVIEEETDREGDEQITERSMSDIRHRFNRQVGDLITANKQIDEVVNFYKSQMQQMARELVKQTEKCRKIREQAQEGKLSRRKKSQTGKSPLGEKKEEDQQLKTRPAPSPFPENECQNCLLQAQRLQALQKQRTNWKSLSAKIDECKRKISTYETQLKEKDSQLETLRQKANENQLREKNDRIEEEKKKLKKDNTTLRGQKVLLSNQLASVKRQLAEKSTVVQAQEAEVSRLKIQIENLNSSLSWHAAALNEVRSGASKERSQQWKDVTDRMQILVRVNQALLKSLGEQEQSLNDFEQKSKRIQEGWAKQSDKLNRKIADLEAILQQKNETIIRLKTGGGKSEKVVDRSGGYHADMVRVLNKRLAEREERVRVLEDALARVSQTQ